MSVGGEFVLQQIELLCSSVGGVVQHVSAGVRVVEFGSKLYAPTDAYHARAVLLDSRFFCVQQVWDLHGQNKSWRGTSQYSVNEKNVFTTVKVELFKMYEFYEAEHRQVICERWVGCLVVCQ